MIAPVVRKRVNELLDQFGYDFTQFTLTHFIRWIEEREKVTFILKRWEAPPGCSGSMLLDYRPNIHILFYNENASPLHQTHIILHELAHYLLGHIPEDHVTRRELIHLFHHGVLQQTNAIFLRSGLDDEQEQEAELLAMTIQTKIIEAARLSALHQPIPLLTDLGLG